MGLRPGAGGFGSAALTDLQDNPNTITSDYGVPTLSIYVSVILARTPVQLLVLIRLIEPDSLYFYYDA